jgi:uncharacterized membrane protein
MRGNLLKTHSVSLFISISALILFFCSSLRHFLFQSTAWDLGIFDQAIYLISRGKAPISSFLDFHILGDHAALIFYLLAWFYKIYPDVSWLLAIQALALAIGALPTWQISRQAGLKETQATAMVVVYLLYPLIFNINLFDFHPDAIALPAFLWAILAAQTDCLWGFCLALIVILSCKCVFALAVAAMGVWLLCEKRSLYGSIALIVGVAWFLVATSALVPLFGDRKASVERHLARYTYLGTSFLEIVQNITLKPWLLFSAIFTRSNLEYITWLLLPVIWGVSPQHLTPLIGAIPALAMNLLSTSPTQKDLIHQYSLPIFPFLLLVTITTLADGKAWLRTQRGIVIWSLISFLALAKFGYFGTKYLKSLGTWQATRDAIAKINDSGSILTSAQIAPHLTHRPIVELAIKGSESTDLTKFDYVLLDSRHPGWESSTSVVNRLVSRLKITSSFQLIYKRDDVFLFKKSLK